jgi:hypothetical protein
MEDRGKRKRRKLKKDREISNRGEMERTEINRDLRWMTGVKGRGECSDRRGRFPIEGNREKQIGAHRQ